MDTSLGPTPPRDAIFFRMDGHKVYEYAVKTVPPAILDCLKKAGLAVEDVDKILIHQANAKMDEAIVKRLLRGTAVTQTLDELVPMTVGWLGNSSVATLPTLLDLLLRRQVDGHELRERRCPPLRFGGRGHERQRRRLSDAVGAFGVEIASSLRSSQWRLSGACDGCSAPGLTRTYVAT